LRTSGVENQFVTRSFEALNSVSGFAVAMQRRGTYARAEHAFLGQAVISAADTSRCDRLLFNTRFDEYSVLNVIDHVSLH
jgi:hypothetical protein